jgi:hypothetical protein
VAAVVRLRDSRDLTGDVVAIIAIDTGESKNLAGASVSFTEGLFADMTATIEGVVWIGPEQ